MPDAGAQDAGAMDVASADTAVIESEAAEDALVDVGATDTVDTTPLPAMPTPSFLVGYNEGWFGGHFATDLTTDFDLAYVNAVLDGITRGGGTS